MVASFGVSIVGPSGSATLQLDLVLAVLNLRVLLPEVS
jgi:hypothetical protein